MKLSFRAGLTLTMASILGLTMVLLGAYSFITARNTAEDLSERILRQTSILVDQRVMGLVDKAISQGALLAAISLNAPEDFSTEGAQPLLQDEIGRLYELMRANPEISGITLYDPQTVNYVRISQTDAGSLITRTSIQDPRGRRITLDWRRFGREFLPLEVPPTEIDDPTTDENLVRAADMEGPFWATAQPSLLDAEAGRIVISYVIPIRTLGGDYAGAVKIDYAVRDLARFLQTIPVGDSGFAFIAERKGTGVMRVVAHPDSNRLLVRGEDNRQRLANFDELGDRRVEELIRQASELGLTQSSRMEMVDFHLDGTHYYGSIRPLTGSNTPDWFVCIVVPSSDFLQPLYQAGVVVAVGGATALLLVIIFSFAIAQRISEPITELAEESTRIRRLDLQPRELPRSGFAEIARLTRSVEQMKTSLRSFEKLVPSEYARHLIRSASEAKLGGERRHLSIYFADLIGFTSLSEKMPPEELLQILGAYLEILSGEVQYSGGTIDKFNGDDVMAFWGAPTPLDDHALRACTTALRSQAKIKELHAEWAGTDKPLLMASYGIASGDVVVGNVGSKNRMNYTVIGDAVNLASRLQGLNKVYRTSLLISEATFIEAGEAIVGRPVDYVSVFGREEPTPIYELIGLTPEVSDQDAEVCEWHERGMRHYLRREWEDAMGWFDRVLATWPEDCPAQMLRERCEEYAINDPGPAWSGAQKLQIK